MSSYQRLPEEAGVNYTEVDSTTNDPSQIRGYTKTALTGSMKQDYPLYPIRFFVLIGFCFATGINGTCWLSTTPIVEKLKTGYEVEATFITFAGLVFMLTYVFFGFFENWII